MPSPAIQATHRCQRVPSCLHVAEKLSAGQDTWFCVNKSIAVAVHKMPGVTMGVNMSDQNRFLVETTDRVAHRTKTTTVNTSEEAQDACIEALRECPYFTGHVQRSQALKAVCKAAHAQFAGQP